MFVNANTSRVGIFSSTPGATLDVNGDTIVRGNLTVMGASTTIQSTTISIQDKVLILGQTTTPTDTTANGCGILVPGGTNNDKTFEWDSTTTAWKSSESINLASGKTFKINNQVVLSGTALGSSITTASGLNSIGALTSLRVSNLNIAANSSTISYGASTTNGDIVLAPKGTGIVSMNGARVGNLADPVSIGDAVNLDTLNKKVMLSPLTATLFVTNKSNVQIASEYLSYIYPVASFMENTICRAVCLDTGLVTIRTFKIQSGSWVYQTSIDITM